MPVSSSELLVLMGVVGLRVTSCRGSLEFVYDEEYGRLPQPRQSGVHVSRDHS